MDDTILSLVISVSSLAIGLSISYWIIKAGVRNGVSEALQKTGAVNLLKQLGSLSSPAIRGEAPAVSHQPMASFRCAVCGEAVLEGGTCPNRRVGSCHVCGKPVEAEQVVCDGCVSRIMRG